MRAWVYTSAGGGLEKSIKLQEDAPEPSISKDQILVKVHSTSLNPVDYKVAELGMVGRLMISVPASPGLDFAGTVARTGSAAKDKFEVGQQVFGRINPTRFGTLGEYVAASPDGCVALPAGVDLEQASCIGTAGLTAYQTIAPHVKPGDKIFINGGSGGVGTFGIQFAKALGCHVTTSCSGKNVGLCKGLGADDVIDYTKDNVSEVLKAKGQVFSLVVDNVGSTPADLYSAATTFVVPDGKFVQIGGGASLDQVKAAVTRSLFPAFLGGGKRKFIFYMTKNKQEDLVKIGQWFAEGKAKAVVDETFSYEDAPKAIEKLKTGRSRGKIVVKHTSS